MNRGMHQFVGIAAAILAGALASDGRAQQTLSTPFNVDLHGGNDTWAESLRFDHSYYHRVRSNIVDYFAVQYDWQGANMSGTLVPWLSSTRNSTWTYHWAGLIPSWTQSTGLATFTPIPSGNGQIVSGNASYWDTTFPGYSPSGLQNAPNGTATIQSGHSRSEPATPLSSFSTLSALTVDTFDVAAQNTFPVDDYTAVSTITATLDGQIHYLTTLTNHASESVDIVWADLNIDRTLAAGESITHEFTSPIDAQVRRSMVLLDFGDVDPGTPWALPNVGGIEVFMFDVVPEPGTGAALLVSLGAISAASSRRTAGRNLRASAAA